MDLSRFDDLVRQALGTGSRRGLVRVILSLPVAGALDRLLVRNEATAKKRKKKKKKKPPTCTPLCLNKACGPDGCGRSCGECDAGETCQDGVCTGCAPDCTGKVCGEDGCGGACPPGCDAGFTCTDNGACRCGSDIVCNGVCCATEQICHDLTDACCTPDSRNATCGDHVCGQVTDNCGISVRCGDCPQGQACDGGGQCICVPNCQGRVCGDDGCGRTCGECVADRVCTNQGACVCRFESCNDACCGEGEVCRNGACGVCIPSCDGQQCGSDGCGGSCGTCPAGQFCQFGVCLERICDVCATGCPFTSVQAAIDAAPAGGTVTVCPGTYPAAFTIRKNLELVGAGDGARGTILQGSGTAPVIEIPRGVTVTLRKLRITGGRNEQGDAGGVWNKGIATVRDCTVTGNYSRNSGGGIGNTGGTLTVINCLITGNISDNWGGGIDTREGTLTATNTTISGNTAAGQTSQPGGGGIHSYGSRVELSGCTIRENNALVVGGGIYGELSTISLTNCTVSANTVTIDTPGLNTGNRGGGIVSDNGSLTLTGCLVSDNFAHEGGGISSTHNNDEGVLNLIDSEISGNQAERLGGGGIHVTGTAVRLTNTRIRANRACCFNEQAAGGGIAVSFAAVTFDEASKVIQNGAKGTGGGIYAGMFGEVTLFSSDNVVDNNPDNCAGTPIAQCLN
ncbi:MAG: hypothetical protein U0031_06120 [Thermomicrobiales bacterium]